MYEVLNHSQLPLLLLPVLFSLETIFILEVEGIVSIVMLSHQRKQAVMEAVILGESIY
ncbi:hypothetical protein IC575_024848 [Cucumis melo]